MAPRSFNAAPLSSDIHVPLEQRLIDRNDYTEICRSLRRVRYDLSLISAEGTRCAVNRRLLAGTSQRFRAIAQKDIESAFWPELDRRIPSAALQAVLEFLLLGTIDISSSTSIEAVYKAALYMEIPCLVGILTEALPSRAIDQLSAIELIGPIINLSDSVPALRQLQEATIKQICAMPWMYRNDLVTLDGLALARILSRDDFCVDDEEEVAELAIMWKAVCSQSTERQERAVLLCVRYSQLDRSYRGLPQLVESFRMDASLYDSLNTSPENAKHPRNSCRKLILALHGY